MSRTTPTSGDEPVASVHNKNGPEGTATNPSGEWGPQADGGKRRHRGRTAAAVVVAVLIASVAVPVIAGLTALGRADVGSLAGSPSAGPRHTLVVGSDSREDLTAEQMLELGTGSVEGQRTDTIFILSTEGARAAIMGLPRDLFVTRCDGSQGRINAAYGIGGADCLVKTVQDLTGIGIDNYVEVSFPGFIDVVGAVNGVEVCLDKPIKDAFANV
ncbi:MAG: anionic cell wall polymer biosynthesis LytR-Cps2A-Psr (LCP) family protein, partial [Glaciecola sp.]